MLPDQLEGKEATRLWTNLWQKLHKLELVAHWIVAHHAWGL